MKATAIAVVAMLLVTGCARETVDWRNVQTNNGQIFKGDDNTPFTGYVTNVPYRQVPGLQSYVQSTVEGANRRGTRYQMWDIACTISVEKGLVDGNVTCDANGKTYLSAHLTDGHVTGDFQWGLPKRGITGTLDADGKFDGAWAFYRPNGDGKYLDLNYSHGQLDGEQVGYLKDGTTVGVKVTYKAGKIAGGQHIVVMRTFADGVKPYSDVTYDDDGKFDGTAMVANEYSTTPGAKFIESHWSHGNPVGNCTIFGSDGTKTGYGAHWGEWDASQGKYVGGDPAGGHEAPETGTCIVIQSDLPKGNL